MITERDERRVDDDARPTAAVNPIIRVANLLLHRGDDGGVPVNRNSVGLNRVDYPLVRRLVMQAGTTPTRRQLGFLLALLRKYERQIGELGFSVAELAGAVSLGVEEARVEAATVVPAVVTVEESNNIATPADDTWELPTLPAPPAPAPARVIPPMADILGPGGIIAQALPGYEARETQIELAQAISDAIGADELILAEAGTGTGKSLAYLIPAIYHGKKTIISTEGKALQDQLFQKDVPFLQSVLPVPFTFSILKGLSNYVCKLKLDDETAAQGLIGATYEFGQLREWLATTKSGDLAEAPAMLGADLTRAVTSTTDECLGTDCPYHGECFAMNARRTAKASDIVIVNHTLLSLDVAVRARTSDGVAILPDRDVVICDEAHSLEDVATKAFTVEITNHTVRHLLRGKLPALAELDETMIEASVKASDHLFNIFAGDDRQTFVVTPGERIVLAAQRLREALASCARQTRATIHEISGLGAEVEGKATVRRLERFAERISNHCDALGDILTGDESRVLYIEKSVGRKGATTTALKSAPISVAADLAGALWEKWPVVATSATLSTHGTFAYFQSRTGAPDTARTILAESPFDFRRNALLYLPPNGAAFDPSKFYQDGSVEYFDRLAGEIEQLLLASDGRAFCLFTSRRALDAIYERIAARLRWTVLRQGDASPAEIIRRFKADGHAVLFGLRTFWAGVDVQGEALSLVIVDKLPFPAPDEPVYQARCDAVSREYNDRWAWFNRLALPLAAIQFKQGFGRLIRTKGDQGCVALMDGRLTTKGYGAGIIRSLPPATQTRSLDAVRAFFGGAG